VTVWFGSRLRARRPAAPGWRYIELVGVGHLAAHIVDWLDR
jgi:hypothetical protein